MSTIIISLSSDHFDKAQAGTPEQQQEARDVLERHFTRRFKEHSVQVFNRHSSGGIVSCLSGARHNPELARAVWLEMPGEIWSVIKPEFRPRDL